MFFKGNGKIIECKSNWKQKPSQKDDSISGMMDLDIMLYKGEKRCHSVFYWEDRVQENFEYIGRNSHQIGRKSRRQSNYLPRS